MNGFSRVDSEKKPQGQRAERRVLSVPGRLTWKDSRGTTRFASVTTRDVSDTGVFIEWREKTALPLYRLVYFQVEREARHTPGIPAVLRQGRVLSAVYRKGSCQRSTGAPEGYGLRLLVDPMTLSTSSVAPVEATA